MQKPLQCLSRVFSRLNQLLYLHPSRFSSNDFTFRTHNCGELRLSNTGEQVTMCGWLQNKRSVFLVLRDAYGTTQIKLPENSDKRKEMLKCLKRTHLESIIKVDGVVVDRGKDRNPKMTTGEIEVVADEIEVINNTPESMPYSIRFNQKNEIRLAYRYMDLRSQLMQKNLRLRAKLATSMRNYLDTEVEFVEVETPTLCRRTPGGAREFIVPAPFPNIGKFYALPQSPQQFKQLLMIGGIDRYYQFARCYRDERSRSDRQPEFTQVDLELSFTNQDGVIHLVENLLNFSWPTSMIEMRPVPPFRRITYEEAIRYYGTDKPDLRIPWLIQECTQDLNFLNTNEDLDFHAGFITVKNVSRDVVKKDAEHWKHLLVNHPKAESFEIQLSEEKHICDTEIAGLLRNKYSIENDDIIVASWGNKDKVQWTLGQLRIMIGESAGLRNRETMEFLWVTDFPLFSMKEDKSFESVHHPFTAPILGHESLLYDQTRIAEIKGQHYDLVLNGVELGGGSIRIHNADMQRYVIENILREPIGELNHLVEALASGAPPHGGFALGFDRYVAIMANCGNTCASIRDVIAFPKTVEKRDIMMGSPAFVTTDQLNRYGVSIDMKSEEEFEEDTERVISDPDQM